MTNNPKQVGCLFGYHKFNQEATVSLPENSLTHVWYEEHTVKICSACKLALMECGNEQHHLTLNHKNQVIKNKTLKSNYSITYKYDTNGNCTYIKWTDDNVPINTQFWFNPKGQLTHNKSPYSEYWQEYDDKGNCVYTKNSDGLKVWNDYRDDGQCIHRNTNQGYEGWLNNNNCWTITRPKNWKYEKFVTSKELSS